MSARDLVAGELLEVRGRVYWVAGFNAYGQAMLDEISRPQEGEHRRASRAKERGHAELPDNPPTATTAGFAHLPASSPAGLPIQEMPK